jgi:regulation of enolase protein 1 (concanavalin A-like superfamily)
MDLPGVPFPLVPSPQGAWRVDGRTVALTVMATPHSDIFVDPGGAVTLNAESMLNAVTLLGTAPAGDFQLSAKVTVDFAATYDAGVLLLWVDERCWGKLCFEFSPDQEPMVVSVVTRGVSDDANAFVVPDRSVWLRVSRIDRTYAYHASNDGQRWRMIRFFSLGDVGGRDRVGFEAQSPTGDGCAVTFEEIRFVPRRLADLRDGS